MTIYAIEVEYRVHTCPADAQPHVVETRRRVVHVIHGRPCLTPIALGDGDVTIACSRREPHDRQCVNCRTIITIQKITVHDLGYQGPAPAQLALSEPEAVA